MTVATWAVLASAAAGERDVERSHVDVQAVITAVRGVHGLALRRMDRRGVGQREVLGDVGGRQHHPASRPQRAVRAAGGGGEGFDLESAVVPDGGDAVGLAVDRPAPVALDPGEVPGIPPGLDEVPDAGDGALQAQRHALLGDAAETDQLGAQLRGQPRGLLVGIDQQQRATPGQRVPEPRRSGRGFGLLDSAGVEQPALSVVVAQHGFRRPRAAAATPPAPPRR